ncbi:acyltransferase family protein [Pedobacter sandarakinus]|uniref:acyltransferase family protein n=1 Tax=Pedobacter sandarakinus TaxID=353156 RepID=UPI0022455CCB|nr:acyltransferase [Pedobacter sandarakinus]MCX2574883.1 acyltransferase [Pedobacter sandarakinus]
MEKVKKPTKPEPYLWLDLIRGVSALAVFTGHLRVLCIADTPVSELDLLGKFVFFITGFGHIAVMIFFVLSGFLIIKSIVESSNKGKFTTKGYAINRLARLLTVLIPCLVIGFALDKTGLHFFGDAPVYLGNFPNFPLPEMAYKLSASVFLGNLFFMQTILVPTFGTNGPLWSLCNEFWYYVVFPLLYFGITIKKNINTKIVLILVAAALLFFIGAKISLYFIIWLMGGISYFIAERIDKKILKNGLFRFSLSAIFIAVVVLTRSKYMPQLFNNYSVGLLFALLIPFLVHINIKNAVGKWISTYLSNISFTLYLAHLPFLFFITSITKFQGQVWNHKNLLYFITYTIITLIYATVLWFIFERNTGSIKKFIFDR